MKKAALGPLLLVAACVRVPVSEPIGHTPPPSSTLLPKEPVRFEYESLGDLSVSAPALRGRPAVIAFLVSDTLAGQAEASLMTLMAEKHPDLARYVIVAVEPADRRELVVGFIRFFTDKAHPVILAAMADHDTLLGQGPFGDVRGLTVVVLDRSGRIVWRRSGVVQETDVARVLEAM